MNFRAAFFIVLGASGMLAPVLRAQGSLNPIGGNGNIINPGVPLSGGPVRSGPRYGTTIPGGTGVSAQPFGSGVAGSNMGASMRPPAVAPSLPRGGGRRGGRLGGGYVGGGYVVPVPVYGGGFDGFYSSVHSPAPGTYDPIFGVYSPGPAAYYQQGDPAAQSSPSVVINQNFQSESVRPQLRDYSNSNLPQPGNASNDSAQQADQPGAPPGDAQFYFLIAGKDSTIHAAAAYWVTGDTLNFVNLQGQRGSLPLNQVDRDLSKRLNAGRSIEFELPPQ